MTPSTPASDLAQAYAACREIARREAKNFYYAFVALPPARRNAICAIYAFMREADDLADDESFPLSQRRARLDRWMTEWRSVCNGAASSNPAFVATHDATRRFAIPLSLLDELVAGVSMDLEPASPAPQAAGTVHRTATSPRLPQTVHRGSESGADTYATFPDLYRYCYLVASVVGLVSIRIFGYADARAEKLAEETGIAFQLTNILRDVQEDAARRRVYLPLEDLAANGLTVEGLLHRPPGPPSTAERALLADYVRRAENYYSSAEALLPLIDRESRPALWVLVTIYHALLKKIERANYDVFTRRIRVSTAKKMTILMLGLARMAWARAFG